MNNKYSAFIIFFLALLCLSNTKLNAQDWKKVNFRKISFSILDPWSSSVGMNNTNQYTWLTNNEQISITIDVGDIPDGKENLTINELIPNIKSFAQEVNNGNKKDFFDFKILSQEYINLGDTKAVLVNQQSTKISGKNKLFNVHSYFVTAKPHFYSVVISYEANSYNDRKIAEKIASSFKFKKEKGPSINETKKWLIDKIVDKIRYKEHHSGLLGHTKTTIYPTYFGITKGNLVFEQTIKRSGDGLFPSEKRKERERIIIPLKEIESIEYENERNYTGKCYFKIFTKKSRMTIIDLDSKDKTFFSYYDFKFECSEEEDLGSRLYKAIMHLKEIIPEYKKAKKKETF